MPSKVPQVLVLLAAAGMLAACQFMRPGPVVAPGATALNPAEVVRSSASGLEMLLQLRANPSSLSQDAMLALQGLPLTVVESAENTVGLKLDLREEVIRPQAHPPLVGVIRPPVGGVEVVLHYLLTSYDGSPKTEGKITGHSPQVVGMALDVDQAIAPARSSALSQLPDKLAPFLP